jgi:dTDP-4-amino-4,6-dideoxygalactose transaminase
MSEKNSIYFNKPHMTGKELFYIAEAHFNGQLSGDGPFTKKCHKLLESSLDSKKALLTHSCTAALEMAAILLDLEPGDEIIMPSYTFVSTANAFVLRGAIPVFIDIRPDTLNIDEALIEDAITSRTRAIVVVHYAGISCDMDAIVNIAKKHDLYIVEDAAQALESKYKNKFLGTIGDIGAISFHETKNIISGEGGAILVNNNSFVERSEIIREKGTNRSQFIRGEVDKYTWRDIGSSYLPGELIAAFLWAQLENSFDITSSRVRIWKKYFELFHNLESDGIVKRPFVPDYCTHNAHLFYLILPDEDIRNSVIGILKDAGVHCLFHYLPLHSSPAGRKFTRFHGSMHHTDNMSTRILRIPLWYGMSDNEIERVFKLVDFAVRHESSRRK